LSAAPGSRSSVVVIGPDHPDSYATNIAAAFNECSITATVVDPAARYARPGTLKAYTTSRRMLKEATKRVGSARVLLVDLPVGRSLRAAGPDLVISVDAQFSAEQIDSWRSQTTDALWALWYPDSFVNLGNQAAFVAGYDHLFFKDPYFVDLLSTRTSLPVHFLPEACAPQIHRSESCRDRAEQETFECDVAVAGNMYPFRRLVLHELPPDIRLKLYGHPPSGDEVLMRSFTGRYVTGRAKALAFSEAAIVLNTLHPGEVRSVNTRLFEAAGCGGFVLTHASPDLDRYFVEGEEVVAFESPSDLREAVRHYLAHPDERRRIASAGQARAHRDHTFARRLDELLAVCGMTERLATVNAST
jgi:spore maturation protein CgeB